MSGTWATDWATNDVVTAAEFRKSMGCVADTTLGVSAASVDLTGLPTTYAHLRIEAYLRGDTVAAAVNGWIRFNGDVTANYDYQAVSAAAASAVGAEAFAQSQGLIFDVPAASAPANVFSQHIIEIAHYANTANNKTYTCLTYAKEATTTGTLVVRYIGGSWRSNSAINRITILPATGNFVAGSRVSVYVMGS